MDGIEPSTCCLRNSDSAYWVTSAQESPRIVIVTHVLSGRERFNCTIWAVYFWKPQWGLATPALYSSKDYGPAHGHRQVDGPAATHSRKAVSGLSWCPSGVTFISLVTLFVNNRIDVKWHPQSCDTSLQRCYQLHISFQRCCQLHANILIGFYLLPGLNSFSTSWCKRFMLTVSCDVKRYCYVAIWNCELCFSLQSFSTIIIEYYCLFVKQSFTRQKVLLRKKKIKYFQVCVLYLCYNYVILYMVLRY